MGTIFCNMSVKIVSVTALNVIAEYTNISMTPRTS
jgi:hypothetical protein